MPAEEYEVEAVMETFGKDETPLWRVIFKKPDGTYHDYIFPQSTLEWRAAEYDIDPEDTEALLDIVLHEPFKAPINKDDPALAAGYVSPAVLASKGTRIGDLEATTLFNAETVQDAREAHLLRIQHAKQNRVKIVPPKAKGKKDPLDKIRDKHKTRDSQVENKRVAVTKARRELVNKREEVLRKRPKVDGPIDTSPKTPKPKTPGKPDVLPGLPETPKPEIPRKEK
jgi:hypothetical protein